MAIDDKDRLGFITDIPVNFNISSMNDENISMCLVSLDLARSLLMPNSSKKEFLQRRTLKEVELMILISIVHDAKPRTHTKHHNPLDAEHTIRVTCRSCSADGI